MSIEVVEPGTADDPFTQDASASADATSQGAAPAASQETPADGTATGQGTTVVAPGTTVAAAQTSPDPDDGTLTPAEEEAISLLSSLIREEVRTEEIPKVQSSYDRRIEAIRKDAAARENQLQEQLTAAREAERQAKLVGLTDAEKQQLQATWAYDDRKNELDTYSAEVDAYYKEVFIADTIRLNPDLALEAGELQGFQTPEEIDSFVKDKAIEFYRNAAATSQTGGQRQPATPAPAATTAGVPPTQAVDPAQAVPAGVNAPSDVGSGSAAPVTTKFIEGPGRDVMAQNIADGWETVKIG